MPALPLRLPLPDFVKAIKWTKKIMYEEGHALPQLIHMWQLIVRHPQLFFPYRAQFVPQMVNSLNRLGLPPNCPIENRELAVALADLILAWEMHRHQPQHEGEERAVKLDSPSQDQHSAKRPRVETPSSTGAAPVAQTSDATAEIADQTTTASNSARVADEFGLTVSHVSVPKTTLFFSSSCRVSESLIRLLWFSEWFQDEVKVAFVTMRQGCMESRV